jgi:hypothetical protein
VSWNYLRDGVTAEQTCVDLEELTRRLDNSVPSNPDVPRDAYLHWTEDAEQQLANTFRDRAIARSLRTDRYWRIREVSSGTMATPATVRPWPLIEAEAFDQARTVRALKDQLVHDMDMLPQDRSELLLVLDTNPLRSAIRTARSSEAGAGRGGSQVMCEPVTFGLLISCHRCRGC